MNDADTTPPEPAAGAELSIPKHRFDEVNARVRRLEEEIQQKDQLYMQDRQRMAASQAPAPATLSPEETGLDPQTHQAVVKIATQLAGRMIGAKQAEFEQQLGILANRTEKAELLSRKGSDKAKYIPQIEQKQREHAQRTGTYLDAETALALIQSDEREAYVRKLEAQIAGAPAPQASAAAQAVASPSGGVPSAQATRTIPNPGSGSAAPAAKSFREMSVEEMEAQLSQRLGAGEGLTAEGLI